MDEARSQTLDDRFLEVIAQRLRDNEATIAQLTRDNEALRLSLASAARRLRYYEQELVVFGPVTPWPLANEAEPVLRPEPETIGQLLAELERLRHATRPGGPRPAPREDEAAA